MSDDQMFGETDLETENQTLRDMVKQMNLRIYCQDKELQKHNAYLVHKGLAEDYIKWKGDV